MMKTITKLLGISALIATSAMSGHAAVAEGTKPKDWLADPSKHVVKVERVSTNADDAKWITAAENLPADAAAVRVAALKEDPNAVVGEKQWWYQELLSVKIPFAVTGDAVTYYSDLVTGYGKQAMNRYMQPNSFFHYKASVAQHVEFSCDGKNFQNVTVVTLGMTLSENFAATVTEGMTFSKQRLVVFDKDGKVIHVSGDGETEALVMAI